MTDGLIGYDLEKAKSNLKIYVSACLREKLRKTDYVHTSEFLSKAKKIALNSKRAIEFSESKDFKVNILLAKDRSEIKLLKKKIKAWSKN